MLGSASYLNWSDEVIESAVGVQQGDPLAPVLFCLVLKKVINAISDSCALDINLWFLDDGVRSQSCLRRYRAGWPKAWFIY